MSTHELLERFAKLPPQLKYGQVIRVGRRLGLGQRRVARWMAHQAQRHKVGEQFSYPRDATVQALLDMAGIELTLTTRGPLAGGRGAEGVQVPTHEPA